jgi:hypothetical protein
MQIKLNDLLLTRVESLPLIIWKNEMTGVSKIYENTPKGKVCFDDLRHDLSDFFHDKWPRLPGIEQISREDAEKRATWILDMLT